MSQRLNAYLSIRLLTHKNTIISEIFLSTDRTTETVTSLLGHIVTWALKERCMTDQVLKYLYLRSNLNYISILEIPNFCQANVHMCLLIDHDIFPGSSFTDILPHLIGQHNLSS